MREFAIDLFCGAGGMTCGLIQAGCTVLAGVDKEEKCEETYIQNRNKDGSAVEFLSFDLFPSTPCHPDGQQETAIRKLKSILRKNDFSKRRGDKLLLAICAPCQPFTKITKIQLSAERKFDRRRDKDLLLASFGIIEALKPDAVLCENVEGINGNCVMSNFSRKLQSLNYSFSTKIINAERFGVPQRRKRTIGIGYNRRKVSMPPSIPDSDETANRVTVKDAIGHLPSLAAGENYPWKKIRNHRGKKIRNHRARALSDLNLKRISCAPPGKSNRYLKDTPYGDLTLTCHRKMQATAFGDTYTRMAGDQLSPTITTKFVSITNGRFGHYDVEQNRGISIKEGALLQTFPEEYVFYPENNMYFSATLIGNAVPPKIAKFFGEYILRVLREGKSSRKPSARKG